MGKIINASFITYQRKTLVGSKIGVSCSQSGQVMLMLTFRLDTHCAVCHDLLDTKHYNRILVIAAFEEMLLDQEYVVNQI